MRGRWKKSSWLVSRKVQFINTITLYGDGFFRSFVAMSLLPAGSCPLFIRSWSESLFAHGRKKRVETEWMHISIGWAGWLRESQICFSTARVSAPICSALERRCIRGGKKKRPRAVRFFYFFIFCRREKIPVCAFSLAHFIRQSTEQNTV